MIKLVFLAQVREKLKQSELEVEFSNLPFTVAELKAELAKKGERWQQVFDSELLLCAINQEMAASEFAVHDGDEVAFFPPVTGG